jgi:predicted dehydrogenase
MSLQVFHYPLIASHPDLFTLHSVLERSAEISPSGEVTKSIARERCGPDVKICKDFQEILNDKDVELVVIGLPPILHFDYAKRCLEAGKHGEWDSWGATAPLCFHDNAAAEKKTTSSVLIEKPITVSATDGRALIEFAKQKNLILYTFQNRRWDADFLAVKEVLKSGKVSVTLFPTKTRYRHKTPRPHPPFSSVNSMNLLPTMTASSPLLLYPTQKYGKNNLDTQMTPSITWELI